MILDDTDIIVYTGGENNTTFTYGKSYQVKNIRRYLYIENDIGTKLGVCNTPNIQFIETNFIRLEQWREQELEKLV